MKMKKILFIILIFLTYSCCTSKAPMQVPVSVESTRPEPKPEPKDKKISKMLGSSNYEKKEQEEKEDKIRRDKEWNKLEKDGTIVKNNKVKQNEKTSAKINLESPGFDKGDINYVVQDTMVVGVINEVNMTISKGVDIKTIIADVKTFTESNLHTDTIRIAPIMRARLIDPSNGINFIIAPKTNAEQFLEIGDYTRWTWDVTPLNKGKNKLSLVVDVIYDNKSKSYQVYDGLIYVYSNETFFQIITKLIIKNWQYLLSSLLIPFGIFLYTKYKKKNDNESKKI